MIITKEKLKQASAENVCFTNCPKRLWVNCEKKGSGSCKFAMNPENQKASFFSGARWAETEVQKYFN